VVEHIADRIAVMYLGQIVELASVESFFKAPRHPYSIELIKSAPHYNARTRAIQAPTKGEPGDPAKPPSGCKFHPRCQKAQEICGLMQPEAVYFSGELRGEFARCHYPESLEF